MSLYQPSRASPARTRVLIDGGYPPPSPRVTFCAHKKSPKKRQPPLGWTPAFVQSDACKGALRSL